MDGKWSLDENGKLVVKEIETDKIKAQSATFGSPEKPNGITLYAPSGSPYCVSVEVGGVLASVAGECGQNQPTVNNAEVSLPAGGETSPDATTIPETMATSTLQ